MANSNTEHSKKLRAASSKAARKKAIEAGGVAVNALIRIEDGAETLKILTDEHGSKGAALRFLIQFYEKHCNKNS